MDLLSPLEHDVEWRPSTVVTGHHTLPIMIKRGIDLCGALGLLIVLAPLLAVVAGLVRLSSPGPILFRQRRVGKGGREFQIYKFRTMVTDNDPSIHRAYCQALIRGEVAATGDVFKLSHDPRITPIGHLLRRFSLDELPQLLNVVKGDMSLVGPRPALAYEVELYGTNERRRLSVTPGITGLWQVSGRNTLNFQQMIDLDLAYIRSWSLALDLKILGQTIGVVLTGHGAR